MAGLRRAEPYLFAADGERFAGSRGRSSKVGGYRPSPWLPRRSGGEDAVSTGDHDLRVHDVTIRIAVDGFSFTLDGRKYHVGGLDVEAGNVGVVLEDVSIGDGA